SSVYCQVPLVLSTPTMAKPFSAPASTSEEKPASQDTCRVYGVSSLVEPSATPGMYGASFTGVTVRPAVSVVVLKAVLPPLKLVSARAPLLPLAWSQARKVMASARVLFQSATGWKARRVAVSAARRRAEASLT